MGGPATCQVRAESQQGPLRRKWKFIDDNGNGETQTMTIVRIMNLYTQMKICCNDKQTEETVQHKKISSPPLTLKR
jgi:hypothetical protein